MCLGAPAAHDEAVRTLAPRRATTAAFALFGFAVGDVVLVVAAIVVGPGPRALLDNYVLADATIGTSLAVAGWLIAWHRPGNAVGWVLLVAGDCYAGSAAAFAALGLAAGHGWASGAAGRVVATLGVGLWPLAIGCLVPAALLLFPDGRPVSPRWRWMLVLAAVHGVLFTATAGLQADSVPLGGPVRQYGFIGDGHRLDSLGPILGILGGLVYLSALVSLVVRYRRGSETLRRQLLWLVLALLAVIAGFNLPFAPSPTGLVAIALIPLAVTVAVLRHQLLDIRLVVSRSVLYLLLTAGVIGSYVGLVALLDRALPHRDTNSLLATLMVALAFNPARLWLQRLVDRAFYGARHDPVRAVAEVGARLADTDAGLDGVLHTLCQVMRFPSASVHTDGRLLAAHGQPPSLRHATTLHLDTDQHGELLVGLRAGESRLNTADERILALIAAPLTVAVHATLLTQELNRSRERLVTAREEERRRLRRDLHDGLGPALTGVVLKADAARRLTPTDPAQAAKLLRELQDETTAAIQDIRRLVYDLRPPALDGLGLVAALREHALQLRQHADGTPLTATVHAPVDLPVMPAAVEVAAYRIATEALTNTARHSTATTATVTLSTDGPVLRLLVHDDGRNDRDTWPPGVGITSMRERAAELGGSCHAGPAKTGGGQVAVHLPLRTDG